MRRLVLVVLLAGCSGKSVPQGEEMIHTVLDIVELICPPEITVGDCHNRVKAWLPARDGG